MRAAGSLILSAFALYIAGCGDPISETATTSSPLIGADSDQLWILARASRVGDGRECKERYLSLADPRFESLSAKCDAWSRHYAEYLRINGFPTVEHAHLQDPAYWRWYLGTRDAISDCRTAIGALSVTATSQERADYNRARHACDPYDDALKNGNQTRTDLGIRYN